MAEDKENMEGATQTIKISELPHIRSEAYISTYCNFAQCSATPWEFRITFGEATELEVDKPVILQHATVLLPPQVAKAMISLLKVKVKEYEENYGEIRPLKKQRAKTEEVEAENAE